MQNTTKKIRFLRTVSTARECYAQGRTFDLPPDEADPQLRAGHAVEVEVEAAKPRKEPTK
jgi:hypothetical protein